MLPKQIEDDGPPATVGLRDIDTFIAEANFVPPIGGEFRVVSAESFNLGQAISDGNNEIRDVVRKVGEAWDSESESDAEKRLAAYEEIRVAASEGTVAAYLKEKLGG